MNAQTDTPRPGPDAGTGAHPDEYAHWTTSEYMLDERPIVAGDASGPGCAKRDPIIVGDSITRQFGAIKAVDVDHVEIPRHKITALIGPNGAGKTTGTSCPGCGRTGWRASAWCGPSSSPRCSASSP